MPYNRYKALHLCLHYQLFHSRIFQTLSAFDDKLQKYPTSDKQKEYNTSILKELMLCIYCMVRFAFACMHEQ